jgi:DNA-binding transcriptional ArsR family regulator
MSGTGAGGALTERWGPTSELFRALSAPARIALIERLALGEARVHELVETLGTSQPLTSQHLRVLRSAHLVTTRREGREIVYALSDDHVAHIVRDAIAHTGEPR